MNNNIVFVAEIGADIDDMIAVEYLYRIGALKCMVLDGTNKDIERINKLIKLGVHVLNEIPEDTKIIFCGGSFTKIAKFVETHTLDLLFANGGFAGDNIVPLNKQLDKFRGRITNRTFNFNLDVNSAIKVLESKHIKNIYLVSKNVCHSSLNVHGILHKDKFLDSYNLRSDKRLHDLLMAKEGINYLYNNDSYCEYMRVDYILEREDIDSMCKWGSCENKESNIRISVRLK